MPRTRSLLATLAALALVPVPARAAASTPPDDGVVTTAVNAELAMNTGVRSYEVNVDVHDGVATLTGLVDSLLDQERAARIAEEVQGVRAVVNRLRLRHVVKADGAIATDVERELALNPATEPFGISATARDGVVTLGGSVTSWCEKHLAGQIARSVPGVLGVMDAVHVTHPARRPDEEIREDLTEALEWDPRVNDALVHVRVHDGNVSLAGDAGSLVEKETAERLAWVDGVKSVDGHALAIQWWARDGNVRGDRLAPESDAAVQSAVEAAFHADPRIGRAVPEVVVSRGAATLDGVVRDLVARHAAREDAEDTVGVFSVDDHLRVRAAHPVTDATLQSEVERAFARDPYLSQMPIEVATHHRAVRLTGEVDTPFARLRARRVVAAIQGVTQIHDDLRVNGSATDGVVWTDPGDAFSVTSHAKADRDLAGAIRSAFRWSPFVESSQVRVAVDDGVATLTGTVATPKERRYAIMDAYEAGAKHVRSRIFVNRGPLIAEGS